MGIKRVSIDQYAESKYGVYYPENLAAALPGLPESLPAPDEEPKAAE